MVNRCAIHHDGFLFDKGGEALVEEISARLGLDSGLHNAPDTPADVMLGEDFAILGESGGVYSQ